ncbi:MAG TPA: phosphotransferase family protein [Frankiaceae bacterium]|jgi:aminoglycoside phosphotransferase (APT) family kinase protein|nr:phosphotransferase family protein [Frankiaceae bacterium]
MSGPLAPSPLADMGALVAWLSRALGASDLRIDGTSGAALNGASNDTMMVRASWRVGGAAGAPASGGFVVRRPPSGPGLYHRYDLAGQFATMAALTDTEIPVPPLVGFEPDSSLLGAPFYVMGEVAGDAPPDLPPYTQVGWVLGLTSAEQAHMYNASIAMLARIHRLDASSLALDHLGPGSGSFGFHEQLMSALRWYEWAVTGQPNPVLDATLSWLIDHEPAPGPEGLNWGDSRVGNMLYTDLEPVCVLDWEMAAIGPPEVDLGWWLFMNRFHSVGMETPTIAGFPDDATTVAMWEDATGREAHDISYYDVFAGFRFGIIVLRAARRMVDSGQLPPDQSFERVNGATLLLADMLGLPTPT